MDSTIYKCLQGLLLQLVKQTKADIMLTNKFNLDPKKSTLISKLVVLKRTITISIMFETVGFTYTKKIYIYINRERDQENVQYLPSDKMAEAFFEKILICLNGKTTPSSFHRRLYAIIERLREGIRNRE